MLSIVRRHVTGPGLCLPGPNLLHGNPLHNIAGDAPPPPVIDLGGPGVGVAGQVLHVLQGHVLGEQIGDHQDPEAVGAKNIRGSPASFNLRLSMRPMELADRGLGESCLCFPRADRKRGVSLGSVTDPGCLQILSEPAVEVVADGDLPLLASLFPEPAGRAGGPGPRDPLDANGRWRRSLAPV